jgi:uncharacterized membrane protein
MKRILVALALALIAIAAPAAAQPLPQLHAVTGVTPGDVLNIRAAPDADGAIIGSLAADATAVEVTARDPSGAWGRVNASEGAGWVALRYLAPGAPAWSPGTLPSGLACLGTEPFWSLAPTADGGAVYSTPEAGERRLALAAHDTGIDGDPRRLLAATAPGLALTAAITPADCSDGMSDRAFALEILLLVEDPAPRLLAGCCSIALGN